MFDISRRELLRGVALSVTMGAVDAAQAQHVHTLAADEKTSTGKYKPKALNDHEFQTLRKLSDFIIPADGNSPGALAANAADWIDLLASQSQEMLGIYTGGIFWLDRAMQERTGASFVAATAEQQIAMLDLIAYRKNDSPELGPGIRFFDWARKMVVDAYYTSPIGIKELGYMGNTAVAKFEIPQEVIDYALSRSPV